jgi:hypothetical protein
MTWVESASPSFRARHDSEQADDADRVLHSLERAREQLSEVFPRAVGDVTVVLHRGTMSLWLSNPMLPVTRLATAPAARRYVAGWAAGNELHVLAPDALDARASNVPGSRQMLALTAASLYAHRVIVENNHELARAITPKRIAIELRWAWLLEGGARWFSGQTEHARPAIARRLRDARAPSFPPGVRDAALLGGTVIDLLAREEGELAAAQFVTRLHPHGARAALSKAFGGRAFVDTEGAWRSHLARLASTHGPHTSRER